MIVTFDIEAQNYKLYKRVASQFDMRNYIVEIGWNIDGGEVHSTRFDEWHRDSVMDDVFNKLGKGDVLNGFNIKYDLLWIWGQKSLQDALKRGLQIYCGQYTEYLLGGHVQEVQLTSMNNIAESYGGGCKIDAVKEMWQAGVLTADVPADLLHDYLCGDGQGIVGDVMNTWLIFKGQVKRMNEEMSPNFKTMLRFRMDGLLATTEMEYNGVYCDVIKGEELRKQLVIDLAIATEELEKFIPEMPDGLPFNWNSNVHKSCLIFGGVAKYMKWLPHTDEESNVIYAKKTIKWPLFDKVPVDPDTCIPISGLYLREEAQATEDTIEFEGKFYLIQDKFKSGKNANQGKCKNMQVPDLDKPKGAQQPHYFKFDGYVKPHGSWKSEQTDAYDNPLYSTGAKIIEQLEAKGLPFTEALVSRTKLDKDLGTYYWKEDKKGERKGMLCLVGPDGIIHHQLHHVRTITSRMSASDPNMQNIPRGDTSDVKMMFCSRFGILGRMAESDYSQLEVVVQGVLTRDTQLRIDLNNRVDFHCKRLSAKLGEDYEYVWTMCHKQEDPEYKAARTDVKKFSFQRAYGAGAAKISSANGIPREDVDALIIAEETLYPGLKKFDQFLEGEINDNRIPTSAKLFINGIAFTRGESHWDSPTGTRYTWRENIAPEFMHDKGKFTGFKPTERKNYPVQGLGGEIVQTMLGVFFRYYIAKDRYDGEVLLVNTVHDCVWLDGKNHRIEEATKDLQRELESVPAIFNKAYPELDVDVPFPVESEVGPNMYDMTVLH